MIHTNFVGRLVKDPELKKIEKEGKSLSVCNVDVAVNRLHGDKVDYIPITVWGKQAEQLVENNIKGSRLAINGNFTTSTYEREDGSKAKKYNVNVDTIEYLDRKIEKEENQEVEQKDYEM